MPLNIYDPGVARLLVDARQDGKAIGIEIGERNAAARITALEAENAALKAESAKLRGIAARLDGEAVLVSSADEIVTRRTMDEMRTLLQGGPDAG